MPTLAMLGFLALWMAWGAVAAVGLPVLAHLLSKTRYREVVFPAARLVQQAVAATSRIETPRHRLLMLLRWLVLMLLVLAFMRPQWVPDAKAGGDSEQGIALVLLIDASASMQRVQDGATLYDRALREAQQLIDQLDPTRDVAAVIAVDDTPASLLPEATAQFSLLRKRLVANEPGYTHANWSAAVANALRLLDDEARAVRVVTLSDQQGSQPDLSFLAYGKPDAGIGHVRLAGPTDNIAIRLVDIRPYPAIAGRPVSATVEVRHFGDQPTTIQLSARFTGQTVEQSLALAPGETRRTTFQLPAANGEREVIEITLDTPDAIQADNITGAILPIQSETRALIVHDANANAASIAKRLATLLNPGEVAGVTLPEVDALAIADAQAVLASADPASLRTVVLINQDPLPDVLSQSLESYAQAGGGVVQFVTDDATNPGQTTTASAIDFDLQPLHLFEGPARAGLASLPWPGVSNSAIDAGARPILIDELERVIVAEMLRGRGRLIAINAALSAEPGGLLAQPAFVVLFNELCRYASPGLALPPPPKPGEPIPNVLRNAAQILVADGADPEAAVFTAPGPYAAMDQSGLVTDLIYVTLDPEESDTRMPTIWNNASAGINSDAAPSSDGSGSATALRDNPIELWPYLVFVVLGLVATESLLLRRFAGPRSGETQGGVA